MWHYSRTIILSLIVILTSGCLHLPSWPPASDEEMQATLIYRTMKGERRLAVITLDSVTSDQQISTDFQIDIPRSNTVEIPLSYRADGIYAEQANKESVRLVYGRNLTDPMITPTPDPDLTVLSYIALQGRKPVLKIRTIFKGSVAQEGTVIPLAADIDNYVISDFSFRELTP
ncbi:hypothetical protein [Parendozoicomonas haliclonae]|uniref:Lipoprotein n=1 Tax=Parendozoicomonas haliclonae TaxID=1960125 RepID=A0A1X7AKA6_9GAMM|nr:hypothetical protein [Parendozoicomonas haliclonae]SMA46696.1 hypothetical protein EHSB41UT_02239 [Parendozoicomonas haliclonae]